MEITETVKNVLSKMIEAAGANGVTEAEAVGEVMKRGSFSYYEIIDSLKKSYQEIGLERTKPHTGKVICYYKPKKEPEESMAVRLAKKLGKRTIGEKERMNILNQYRR